MSEQLKPYRLVNARELSALQQRFAEKINIWNDQYALLPFYCQLSSQCKPADEERWFLFSTEKDVPIALLPESGLTSLKYCLFGELSDCFNAVSQSMLILFVRQLLELPDLQQSSLSAISYDEWFYKGSPSVAVSLSPGMNLYLHPRWVLSLFPMKACVTELTSDLHQALANEQLPCQVELIPVNLQLKDVIRLQVGDVIKTEHSINQPLLLKNHHQRLCDVEISKLNHYKSIQIKSSL